MIKGLIKYATMLANTFPTKAGISNTLSPRNIVHGLPNIDFATLKYELGEYGELSEDSTVTNTQAGRTKGALALYPRGQHGILTKKERHNQKTIFHLSTKVMMMTHLPTEVMTKMKASVTMLMTMTAMTSAMIIARRQKKAHQMMIPILSNLPHYASASTLLLKMSM